MQIVVRGNDDDEEVEVLIIYNSTPIDRNAEEIEWEHKLMLDRFYSSQVLCMNKKGDRMELNWFN